MFSQRKKSISVKKGIETEFTVYTDSWHMYAYSLVKNVCHKLALNLCDANDRLRRVTNYFPSYQGSLITLNSCKLEFWISKLPTSTKGLQILVKKKFLIQDNF